MLKKLPTLLGLSEEIIKEKAEFYQSEFNITKTEFIKMVNRIPALLSYSEDGVKEKAENDFSCGRWRETSGCGK